MYMYIHSKYYNCISSTNHLIPFTKIVESSFQISVKIVTCVHVCYKQDCHVEHLFCGMNDSKYSHYRDWVWVWVWAAHYFRQSFFLNTAYSMLNF